MFVRLVFLILCLKNVIIKIKMKILLFVLSLLFFFNLNINIEASFYNDMIKFAMPIIVVSLAFMSRIAWLLEDFWSNYLKLIISGDLFLCHDYRLISW